MTESAPRPDGFVVEPVPDEELRRRYPERFDPDVGWDEDRADWAPPTRFFPNALRIMARDPELTDAVLRLAAVVRHRPGRVDRGFKLLLGHVASNAAGCRYCTAHAATLAHDDAGVAPEKIEAIWSFESSPHFDEAERVALRWAVAAGSSPNEVTREHYDDLHRFYDDDQIVEMASIICLYGWFNRWNDSFLTPLEATPLEFALEHLAPSGWTAGRHLPIEGAPATG